MIKKYPSEDEIRRLAEHYEQLGDKDILAEWERGVLMHCKPGAGLPFGAELLSLAPRRALFGANWSGASRRPER